MANLVEVAAGNENFKTLVAAVTAAGLVDALAGEGPFTVFAPVDTAFQALPEGTVETLVKPENKETLTGILTYHVVAGLVHASDLSDGQVVTTLNGQTLAVSIQDGVVKINNATVIIPDVEASNGVVHAIDMVLMPA